MHNLMYPCLIEKGIHFEDASHTAFQYVVCIAYGKVKAYLIEDGIVIVIHVKHI